MRCPGVLSFSRSREARDPRRDPRRLFRHSLNCFGSLNVSPAFNMRILFSQRMKLAFVQLADITSRKFRPAEASLFAVNVGKITRPTAKLVDSTRATG